MVKSILQESDYATYIRTEDDIFIYYNGSFVDSLWKHSISIICYNVP